MEKTLIIIIIVALTLILTVVTPPFFMSAEATDEKRKVILWVEPEYLNTTEKADTLISWCNEHNINSLAIHGSISAQNLTYLKEAGLNVFQTTVPTLDPPSNFNYTDYMNNIKATYENFSGIIFNDGHYQWYKARSNGYNKTVCLRNYQSFIEYAEDILVPHFGKGNVIMIMAIYSDDVDYALMTRINATSIVFSYYYPPDPIIRHFRAENWFNTSASAWNIKSWYDKYGLNTYYQYEGWLWIPSNESDYPTETILKTSEAILKFGRYYIVQNIQIFGYKTIVNNDKYSRLVKHFCKLWMNKGNAIKTNGIFIKNWTDEYWKDDFLTLPENKTEITYQGWHFQRDTENFTYAISDGCFDLIWNGSRNQTGWGHFSMERAFKVERGLSLKLSFTPTADFITQSLIIKEGFVKHKAYVYRFTFTAFTKELKFCYYDKSRTEKSISIGVWTQNTTYLIEMSISLTDVSVAITDGGGGGLNWNYSIPSEDFKYNSVKVYTFLIKSTIGNLSDTYSRVHRLDYVNTNPLTAWNPPFEYLNYIGYNEKWNLLDIWNPHDVYIFVEDGIITYSKPTVSSITFNLYCSNETKLILNCTKAPDSVFGDVANYSFLSNRLAITTIADSPSQIIIQWELPVWLPVTLAMGIFGFILLGASPTYTFYKIKQREYSSAFCWGFLMFIIGIGLVIVWLWG